MDTKKEDWSNKPMPEEHVVLQIDKQISSSEMEEIKQGLRPSMMEDKWFIYSEDQTIYFHRSWRGNCIYKAHYVQVNSDIYMINKLIVNRNKDEYKETDSMYDLQLFNFLVDGLLLSKSVEFPLKDANKTEEQKMIERHSSIGYGMSRKDK